MCSPQGPVSLLALCLLSEISSPASPCVSACRFGSMATSEDAVSRLQAAARSFKPEEQLKTTRRALRNAAGHVRDGPLTGAPPPFGVDRATYGAPAKGKHDGYWLGSTAGSMPAYHMRAGKQSDEPGRAGLKPDERYSGRTTPLRGHTIEPRSGEATPRQAARATHSPTNRGQMDSQAWREGKQSEAPSGRAPGACPGVDHLQGSSCNVPQAEAQRRLAGPGMAMPYRVVDTNARTLSQQSTQQQADPTARPARNAAVFEAQADRTLAPGQTAQSVRAGFALPCNRNTRAQMQLARHEYPQTHQHGHEAAEAFADATRSCVLSRLKGQGCPDLLTPRSSFPATA